METNYEKVIDGQKVEVKTIELLLKSSTENKTRIWTIVEKKVSADTLDQFISNEIIKRYNGDLTDVIKFWDLKNRKIKKLVDELYKAILTVRFFECERSIKHLTKTLNQTIKYTIAVNTVHSYNIKHSYINDLDTNWWLGFGHCEHIYEVID